MGEEDRQPASRDSLARFLSISSLVLAFCVFIAVIILAPWTVFRLRDHSDKMFEKLDAERFLELQAMVNQMEHKMMVLEVAQANARTEEQKGPTTSHGIDNAPTLFPELDVAAKYKRSIPDSNSSGGSTVYTRWGRSACPSTPRTSIVYKGIVGVSCAKHSGGGTNHQCLPLEPDYGYKVHGQQFNVSLGGSLLNGVKFRVGNINPFNNDQNHGLSLHTEDATCSVCFVKGRSVTIMIPAQTRCPQGWIREYGGYLMASKYDSFRVDYICVDDTPDPKPSGENADGDSFLHPVEGGCGALPCPNYLEGSELACVVCTR